MGVTHLWRILEKIERPLDLDEFTGAVVAVDISIWIHQILHGVKDKDSAPYAYLIAIFHRICKLLHHRIKPIFVFDGSAPALKKTALIDRRKRKEENEEVFGQARLRLLAIHARNVLTGKITEKDDAVLPLKRKVTDMFTLPDKLPDKLEEDKDIEMDEELLAFVPRRKHATMLEIPKDISDVFSAEFAVLPLHEQSEILEETLARQKKGSWRPRAENSEDFSLQQIAAVVKRNQVVQKLNSVREAIMKEDSQGGPVLRPLASDPRTVYMLEKRASLEHDRTPPNARSSPAAEEITHLQRREALLAKTAPEHDSDGSLSFDEHELETSPQKRPRHDTGEASQAATIIIDASPSPAHVDVDAASSLGARASPPAHSPIAPQPVTPTEPAKATWPAVEPVEAPTPEPAAEQDVVITSVSVTARELTADLPTGAATSIVIGEADDDPHDRDRLAGADDHPPSVSPESSQSKCAMDTSVDTGVVPQVPTLVPPPATESPTESERIESKDEVVASAIVSAAVPEPARSLQSLRDAYFAEEAMEIEVAPQAEPTAMDTDDDMEVVSVQLGVGAQDVLPQPTEPVVVEIPDQSPADEESEENDSIDRSGELLAPVHPAVEQLGVDEGALAALADRAARAAAGLNTENISEVQELLRMFGLPYVVAPAEAESQCAAFEESGIAAAVITDDSDVFLFGGRKVFRNVFSRTKNGALVDMDDIESLLGLNRESLIQLALLLGCDYTPGVGGIGPVNALAILKAFPGPFCLNDFKDWILHGAGEVTGLPKNLRTAASLPPGFPEEKIVEAFAEPHNDPCPECSWGIPDLQGLRSYARSKFGWDPARVDDYILPLLRVAPPSAPAIPTWVIRTKPPTTARSMATKAALKAASAKAAASKDAVKARKKRLKEEKANVKGKKAGEKKDKKGEKKEKGEKAEKEEEKKEQEGKEKEDESDQNKSEDAE